MQTLKTELEMLRMKDTEQLDEFCIRLYGIVTNIRVLGETVEEAYVVKKLLRVVPSKYLQIASTIEQFGDLEQMTVEETVGRLKAHDERIREQTDSKGNQLLLTEEEWAKIEAHEENFCSHERNGLRGQAKGLQTKEVDVSLIIVGLVEVKIEARLDASVVAHLGTTHQSVVSHEGEKIQNWK